MVEMGRNNGGVHLVSTANERSESRGRQTETEKKQQKKSLSKNGKKMHREATA